VMLMVPLLVSMAAVMFKVGCPYELS